MKPLSTRDMAFAAIVSSCALALYAATLLPDIGGTEDSPKFQFVGYVLGTAHPPGYPLYVLLTHAFVKLPIRTIAYRANLFSAVMAALACGLAYLIARQMGSGRWAAACTALALAAGVSFWQGAVFAEVYSLAAAMVALTIALLLWWGAQQGAARLLAAVAAFALGLGNHLTIVGLLPAGALYILARNWRALTPRVIAASAAILILGVSQYGLIVLRSRQGAPYLESAATSLPELVSVLTAQRFADHRFAFGPAELLTVQLPAVASVIRREMGVIGVLLMAAGVIAAIRKRNAAAALVAGAAGGLLFMVLNLSGDVQGFITPMMVLLWPLAAFGIQALTQSLPSWSVGRVRVGALALVAVTAIPAANVLANYSTSDHSGETENARFLRKIYSQLPRRAGVVGEGYWYNMVLDYLAFTGESGSDKDIVPVDSAAVAVRDAAASGRRVFAFAGGATYLGAEGLRFQREPHIESGLLDWLKALPRGSVVVGAAAFAAMPIEFLPIDRRQAPSLGQPRSFTAFSWVAGQSDAVVDGGNARASHTRGGVLASADERGARVELRGRKAVEVDDGIALAVFAPDGSLSRVLEFGPGEPLDVPFEGAFYEVTGESPCVDVTTDAWSDITPIVATGSWLTTLHAYGSVVIESAFTGSAGLHADARTMLGNGTARNTSLTRSADGSSVLLTELTRPDYHRGVFRLALDQRPATARARLQPGGAQPSVTICAHQPFPLFSRSSDRAVLRTDFESEAYFGAGWSAQERTDAGTVRRGTGERETLFLPLETGYDYRIALNVDADQGTRLKIAANGMEAGACELRDIAPCEVSVPATALRTGITNLTLSTWSTETGAAPPGGLAFRGARLRRSASR
jgi:Protein O-mannosyl-transferase TMEM260-like